MDNHFLGLDCSSKGVHGVILNREGEYVEKFKWMSNHSDFEERFIEFLHNFLGDLGIIKEIINNNNTNKL